MTDKLEESLAERRALYDKACNALRKGVWIRNPQSVYIRGELHCGAGVEIDVNVIIEGVVRLGDGVKIGPNCILIDSTIGANTKVNAFSMIEGSNVGADSVLGPYARLRPGSELGDSVQIGNFVEIKNSEIGDRSRINHLSFLGDATLGKSVTIGAGTITCNHNFIGVSRTKLGDDAYVGSGCLLVAPVEIGAGATIAAGTTVTKDAQAGALTIGRAEQETVVNWKRPSKPPEAK